MHICFISQSLYTLGGIQRVLASLLNKMVGEDNIEVTVMMPVLPEEKNIFHLSEKVHIINTVDYEKSDTATLLCRGLRKINQKTLIFSRMKLSPLLKRFVLLPGLEDKYVNAIANKFDVVVGVGCWYSILLAYLSHRIDAVTFGWMHSTYESYFYNRKYLAAGFEAEFQRICKKLKGVFVLTKSDKEIFDKKLSIQTVVLYNPVDDAFFLGGRKSNNKHNLLFVGRLVMQHKGLDFLIPIMKKVLMRYPDASLTVVGSGPDEAAFTEMIRDADMVEKIHLVGLCSNVKPYYKEANIVIVPSRWEGFGVVLIEAMASGTPVVAFENKGPKEIISNGIDGMLIKQYDVEAFSDGIVNLLDNAELWEKMSEKAYQKALRFSAEKTLERFMHEISSEKG